MLFQETRGKDVKGYFHITLALPKKGTFLTVVSPSRTARMSKAGIKRSTSHRYIPTALQIIHMSKKQTNSQQQFHKINNQTKFASPPPVIVPKTYSLRARLMTPTLVESACKGEGLRGGRLTIGAFIFF